MRVVVVKGPTDQTKKKKLQPEGTRHLSNEIRIFNLGEALFDCQITSTANFIYELMHHNWIALKNYNTMLPPASRAKALKVLTKFNPWTLELIRSQLSNCLRFYFKKDFDIHRPLAGTSKLLVHDAQTNISPVIKEVATMLDFDPNHFSILLPLRHTIFFNAFNVSMRDYTIIADGTATVFDQEENSFKAQGDGPLKSLELVNIYQWKKNATTDENLTPFQSYEKPGIHCSFCGVSQNVVGLVPLKDIPDEMVNHPYFARFYIDYQQRLDLDCFAL